MEKIYMNKKYKLTKDSPPRVSIITPTYNKEETIARTIESILGQTYRNFEYIIVDDGSKENEDEIIRHYMDLEQVPILYLRKENGGVHTARNMGIRYSRGELTTGIDADDELVPEALDIFVSTWDRIPDEEKMQYREVVCQCIDQNGNRIGEKFPEGINNMSRKKAYRICQKLRAEHFSIDVTKIRKDNLFPEPAGIRYVEGNLIWDKLNARYRSYYINDMLRIYHTDIDNSLMHTGLSIQKCKDIIFRCSYELNHWCEYEHTIFTRCKRILRYKAMCRVLSLHNEINHYKIEKLSDKFLGILATPFSLVWAVRINKRLQLKGR